jgi:hypothetical protein
MNTAISHDHQMTEHREADCVVVIAADGWRHCPVP